MAKYGYTCQCGWHLDRGTLTRREYASDKSKHAEKCASLSKELEKSKRGTYAGAVGYFGFDGNSDSCIALRTIALKDGKAYVQAGAGIVADSTPEGEYQETANKAMGMMRAIERAKEGR